MDKIELQILGISSGHTATSYTLILEEKRGNRKLPIIIGTFEAQAIAIEIERINPVRPMTHDLFTHFAEAFDITIKEVVIHRLQDGVFFSNIICTNNIVTEPIDARTSDAIALALRFKCPIYTYENIMEDAGMILTELDAAKGEEEEDDKSDDKPKVTTLQSIDIEELEKMLVDMLEIENYVEAAQIRDEINRRKKGEV
jgi:bifunctional DNase/RNase